MEKILGTIDLTKIDKSRIVERRYTNNAGHEVIEKNYEFEIVPLKESKLIKDGGTWQIMKTHFLADAQTKEERVAKAPTKYIGNGRMLKNKVVDDVDNQQPPF